MGADVDDTEVNSTTTELAATVSRQVRMNTMLNRLAAVLKPNPVHYKRVKDLLKAKASRVLFLQKQEGLS